MSVFFIYEVRITIHLPSGVMSIQWRNQQTPWACRFPPALSDSRGVCRTDGRHCVSQDLPCRMEKKIRGKEHVNIWPEARNSGKRTLVKALPSHIFFTFELGPLRSRHRTLIIPTPRVVMKPEEKEMVPHYIFCGLNSYFLRIVFSLCSQLEENCHQEGRQKQTANAGLSLCFFPACHRPG